MANTCENLIILGAGATAAISEGCLPIGENFFTKNAVWSFNKADYPHLAFTYQRVVHLKRRRFKRSSPVSLTDIWLFLDTVLKYHSATKNNNDYDYRLLRNRYKNMGSDMPSYLQSSYLNANYPEITAGMRPLLSPLKKKIYVTFPQDDAVVYFLIIAGWELKHLLYKTYDPNNSPCNGKLYASLLERLNGLEGLSILSFNYDICFEKASNKPLYLSGRDETLNGQKALDFCKPHGGWNIRHVDACITPFCDLSEFVKEAFFDKFPTHEERPAMIPYFSYPDEIKELHRRCYPLVGKYFRDQHDKMKKLFQNAKNIVSIGYSFSKDDRHVRNIMDGLPKINGRGKRLFCILGECRYKKDIMALWQFNKGDDGKAFIYDGEGFDVPSIDKIKEFFENNSAIV